jgi:hypothetical protein
MLMKTGGGIVTDIRVSARRSTTSPTILCSPLQQLVESNQQVAMPLTALLRRKTRRI